MAAAVCEALAPGMPTEHGLTPGQVAFVHMTKERERYSFAGWQSASDEVMLMPPQLEEGNLFKNWAHGRKSNFQSMRIDVPRVFNLEPSKAFPVRGKAPDAQANPLSWLPDRSLDTCSTRAPSAQTSFSSTSDDAGCGEFGVRPWQTFATGDVKGLDLTKVPSLSSESLSEVETPGSPILSDGCFESVPHQVRPALSPQCLPKHVRTLVVLHLPKRCSLARLLEVWQPDASFDFMYLPYSLKQRRHTTYAFMNFTSHEAVVAFCEKWQGKQFPTTGTASEPEFLAIEVAKTQGFLQNVYERRSILSKPEKFHPAVFYGKERASFAAVAKKLESSCHSL